MLVHLTYAREQPEPDHIQTETLNLNMNVFRYHVLFNNTRARGYHVHIESHDTLLNNFCRRIPQHIELCMFSADHEQKVCSHSNL